MTVQTLLDQMNKKKKLPLSSDNNGDGIKIATAHDEVAASHGTTNWGTDLGMKGVGSAGKTTLLGA